LTVAEKADVRIAANNSTLLALHRKIMCMFFDDAATSVAPSQWRQARHDGIRPW